MDKYLGQHVFDPIKAFIQFRLVVISLAADEVASAVSGNVCFVGGVTSDRRSATQGIGILMQTGGHCQ